MTPLQWVGLGLASLFIVPLLLALIALGSLKGRQTMSTTDSHWAPPPECSTTAHDDLDTAEDRIRALEAQIADEKVAFRQYRDDVLAAILEHNQHAEFLEEQLKVARERTAAAVLVEQERLESRIAAVRAVLNMAGVFSVDCCCFRRFGDIARALEPPASISSSVQSHCDGREE